MKRKVLFLMVLTVAGLLASGCSGGSRGLNVIPAQQQISMGQESAPQFEQEFGGRLADAGVQGYVSGVGNRVAAQVPNPQGFKYSFTVLNSPIVNAFALPGGPIYVTRGLLANLADESMLAGVLAHEATHVYEEHSAEQITMSMGAGVLIELFGMAAGGGAAPSANTQRAQQVAKVAAQLGSLKYSRSDETESDLAGVDWMTRAGYQPQGMVRVMQLFQKLDQGGMEFLKTHPNPSNRVSEIQSKINASYPTAAANPSLIVGQAAYQQAVLSRIGGAK